MLTEINLYFAKQPPTSEVFQMSAYFDATNLTAFFKSATRASMPSLESFVHVTSLLM
jgi:hypothetical protein